MNGNEHLTIELPPPDAAFAKDYAERHHISISELFDKMLQGLRYKEEDPIGPTIRRMIGILPHDMDTEAAKAEHLTHKYLNGEGNS
jgi:hypothetical protein